jgi:flagellar hook-associated protein 2
MGVGEVTTMSFSETQAAQDASFTLDGINITKSSNTISDVISGATLTLTSAGSGTIKISTDIEEIKAKITSFVSGYNDLLEYIQGLLKFDQNTLESGNLFGNIAVQGLQNTLRRIATGRVAGAQVGIRT